MSNLTVKFLLAASVLVLGGITAVSAQVPGNGIKVSIAEPFAVRGKILPAGDYTVSRTLGITDSSSTLTIRGDHDVVIFETIPSSSTTAAKDTGLVFENIDGQLFLSKIVIKGETLGKQVLISKSDIKRIAKLTKKPPATETGL